MGKKVLINTLKGIIITTCIVIGNELRMISFAMIMLIFLMIVDYISGLLASKKEAVEHPHNKKYGWSSKKSIIGIYKKVGYILTILVAVSTDYVLYVLLQEMGMEYQVKTIFGYHMAYDQRTFVHIGECRKNGGCAS